MNDATKLAYLATPREAELREEEKMISFVELVTRICHVPEGEPIFHERATIIEIEDDAGGEYIVVSQPGDSTPGRGTIAISPGEWETLREAIDGMVKRCRG